MKKLLLIATLFLTVASAVLAQDDDDDKKNPGGRVEALKIAYLTQKLNLSTEEAQRFWPIYNKYAAEIRKVRVDGRLNKEPEIEIEEKLLNIRKKYNGEFTKALSAEKVNAFFKAEKDFGTVLQKELMERRQQRLEKKRNN
jgi:Na+-translocating ferredoxin:NAD+ oxidoreductase RNF subunit RnfB